MEKYVTFQGHTAFMVGMKKKREAAAATAVTANATRVTQAGNHATTIDALVTAVNKINATLISENTTLTVATIDASTHPDVAARVV